MFVLTLSSALTYIACHCCRDKERGQHLHYDFIVVLDSTINCREYLKNSDAVSYLLL